MASGIYEIRNIANDKRYIGSAVNLSKRWSYHRGQLKRGVHHSDKLQHAWRKHGGEQFSFRVLLICAKHDLLFFEQRCMDALSPEYNICKIAGSCAGRTVTPQQREKIRNSLLGKRHSQERRANVSAAVAGRAPPSEETKAKMRARHIGSKRSTEARANMSKASLGKPKSAEHRANISKGKLVMYSARRTAAKKRTEA